MSSDKINPKFQDAFVNLNLGMMGLQIQIPADSPFSKSILSLISADDLALFRDYYNPEFRPLASFINAGYWNVDEISRYECRVIRENNTRDLLPLVLEASSAVRIAKDVNDKAQYMAVAALKLLISMSKEHKILWKALLSSGTMLPIELLLVSPKDIITATDAIRRVSVLNQVMADGRTLRLDISPSMYFHGNGYIDTTIYILPLPKSKGEDEWATIHSSDLSEENLDALIKSIPFFDALSQLSSVTWHKALPFDILQKDEVCTKVLDTIKEKGKGRPLSFSLSLCLAYLHPHLGSFEDESVALEMFNSMCKYLAIYDFKRDSMIRSLPAYITTAFGVSLVQVSRDLSIPKLCQAMANDMVRTEIISLKKTPT